MGSGGLSRLCLDWQSEDCFIAGVSSQPGKQRPAVAEEVEVISGDSQAEGDHQGATDGRYGLEQDSPAGGGEFAFMAGIGEDAGGHAPAGEGQEADQHQREGQAQAEDAYRVERACHDVCPDAQQHDDGGRRAGHDAPGDAQQQECAEGQGLRAGCGGKAGGAMFVIVTMIVGVRVGVMVVVGVLVSMVMIMRMAMRM